MVGQLRATFIRRVCAWPVNSIRDDAFLRIFRRLSDARRAFVYTAEEDSLIKKKKKTKAIARV